MGAPACFSDCIILAAFSTFAPGGCHFGVRVGLRDSSALAMCDMISVYVFSHGKLHKKWISEL